jgi:hypothetical protein
MFFEPILFSTGTFEVESPKLDYSLKKVLETRGNFQEPEIYSGDKQQVFNFLQLPQHSMQISPLRICV